MSAAMELCFVLSLYFAFVEFAALFLFASMIAKTPCIGVLNAERRWEPKSIYLSDEIN